MTEELPSEYANTLDARGFDLLRYIERGGYGRVFEARHRQFDRSVAVKFFDTKRHERTSERFVRESKLLAKVVSPHIPYIITAGTTPRTKTHYYVMQYVRGTTLRAELKRRNPLNLGKALRYSAQIAAALRAAHSKNIVHRDVSSSNVMIASEPSEHVFLIDFSLGICLSEEPGVSRYTGSGVVLGTYKYIAPELREGARNTSPQADVFSFGALMCEMFTGRVPPDDISIFDFERALRHKPSSVAGLVARCCSQMPGDRPTAAQVERELGELLSVPPPRGRSAPSLALCPNVVCGAAEWHVQDRYFLNPNTRKDCTEAHCSDCGAKLIYECETCGDPFKGKRYCSGCGAPFWKGSHCGKCASPLYRFEVGTDLASGCQECTPKSYDSGGYGGYGAAGYGAAGYGAAGYGGYATDGGTSYGRSDKNDEISDDDIPF